MTDDDDFDFDWDEDDAPAMAEADTRTSLLQAFLVGLEQELNEIEPSEENKLLDFAPYFARFLSKLAEDWEKSDFSLIIYKREDNKPIIRKIGENFKEVSLLAIDDVLIIGERFIERVMKEQGTFMGKFNDYLDENVLAHLPITGAEIGWAMEHSVNALLTGYQIVEPYRGGYFRKGGGQDRRQFKNKNLILKAGF